MPLKQWRRSAGAREQTWKVSVAIEILESECILDITVKSYSELKTDRICSANVGL